MVRFLRSYWYSEVGALFIGLWNWINPVVLRFYRSGSHASELLQLFLLLLARYYWRFVDDCYLEGSVHLVNLYEFCRIADCYYLHLLELLLPPLQEKKTHNIFRENFIWLAFLFCTETRAYFVTTKTNSSKEQRIQFPIFFLTKRQWERDSSKNPRMW